MLIKIDLETAYDRITWSCIKDTLNKAGFPQVWTRNIMQCIETVEMMRVWNGKTFLGFKPSRGIRQGDPISPYLFILCMERLRHIINKVVEGRQMEACQTQPIQPSSNPFIYTTF